ncbi:MAG: DNA-directed RNA polymerase subunit beta [Bacteroidales bacterium]|nr:DNA-directed RNA polymerase subunit beta [Bacteroidales bacterium]
MKERIKFGKSLQYETPDLLEIQLQSFKDFFQLETTPENRKNEGLFKVFKENFPITDSRGLYVLDFVDYYVDPPRYTIEECMERGLTYSVPFKARLYLYCTDPEHEDFEAVTQDVYLGPIPYMTPKGTFIINGSERVVVSQMHRSPGVFFQTTRHPNGRLIYSARIIPLKGTWIEFTTDIQSVMYAYIDRKKKVPMTTLLRAIGYETDKDILEIFNLTEEVEVNEENLKNCIGRKLAAREVRTWIEDFVDEDTGELTSLERTEVLIERETVIEEIHIPIILKSDTETILLHRDDIVTEDYSVLFNTLQKDPANNQREALEYIYRQLRNTEPPDKETALQIIDKLFFSDKKYDLGEVGRYKINKKLGRDTVDINQRVLTHEDIIDIIKYLINLINNKTDIDDIDHLSNRRVRTVGEQLYMQFGVGLARMARTIRERMNVRDNEVFKPIDLINAKALSSVINTFFGTNQLSQLLDQTNPLSELTHKRRVSALGPGGLSRERAGFEVRDVHYTHYGRLCPIETPEGPNIGLINSLTVYSRINDLGFIETPYRRVVDGVVHINESPIYLTAEDEENYYIAPANTLLDENGLIVEDLLMCRYGADFPVVPREQINLMDVATNQIASVSASLIPFLENDDANRALMGSNMMRQAVPLLNPEVPIIATGLEAKVAESSRVLINAEHDGIVEYVDAKKIVIRYDLGENDKLASFDDDATVYELTKFLRTNQNTIINLIPIVKKGDKVKKGQVLCEGFATKEGELALGRNLLAAFMPWKGYNYEDAIVISERVIKEDLYTSIHIEEFSTEVRETKRGVEELTNDIPNVSIEATKDLDSNGIIRVGAEVREGDILIGKITPKGETDPTPEERLLRAIFGDKAGDVKDASLKTPPGTSGTVIDTKLFSRLTKNKKEKEKEKHLIEKAEAEFEKVASNLRDKLIKKLLFITEGLVSNGVYNKYKVELIPKGEKFTARNLQRIENYLDINPENWTLDEEKNKLIKQVLHNYEIKYKDFYGKLQRNKYTLSVGDDLPTGIVKLAKVYIATKRKLKVGDKMAGRHGNKGIVAKIVSEADMPFLPDGTPIDIVLNPLGVPSRMNLGQIYETVLGWAGKKLGLNFATPIFDGATIDEINEYIKKADLPDNGQVYLYDGGTGERFDQPTTVGVIYMMKLHHLVDDKMHARSIGPYSLITQQPLGGKSHFGGQRFGEMEVWSLEAFGAAHILREVLTVKSDDVTGRAKAYEAIVKGRNLPEPGIPESFNVLVHELRGLGLKVTFEE